MTSTRLNTLPHLALYFLWADLLLHLLLAFLVRKHGAERRYPAFSLFIYTSAAKAVLLFWIAACQPLNVYYDAYYISSGLSCVLIALCALEVYLKVFGPRLALPAWAYRNVVVLMPAVITTAFVLAGFVGSLKGNLPARLLWTGRQSIFTASCAALVVMIGYSRRLRIAWPRVVAGIAQGFVLMLSVNMGASVVIGRAAAPFAIVAAFAGQSAVLMSLAWWVRCLWRREAEPVLATSTQVSQIMKWTKEAIGH